MEYWRFKEELSVEDGLLFKCDRLVTPRPLRAKVLHEVHGAHLGENKSLCFAIDYVFWPSMTAWINNKVSPWPICNAFHNRQQRESLHPHDIPGLPWLVWICWSHVPTGHWFLLKVLWSRATSPENSQLCYNNLKKIFARFGIPNEAVSDNRLQYSNTRNLFNSTREFKEFANEWGSCHTTSSLQYPQSNGAAERAVQTTKGILKRAAADHKDPFEGLLKYRNTPFHDIGVSPAKSLTSLRTHTVIPTNHPGICLHLQWGTRCQFVQTGGKSGAKRK